MTIDYIADALSELDDRYITQAIAWPKKRIQRTGKIAACLLVATGLIYCSQHTNISQLAYSISRLLPMGSSSSACLAAVGPEEIFTRKTAIFRGTVTDIHRYKDHSVYTIQVSHSIRGGFTEGGEVRLLTVQGILSGNSLEGYLRNLSVGTEAVFMPYRIADGPGVQSDISYLDFISQGDCYISEGYRYLFVQGPDGVLYDSSTFDIPASGESVTLDDVEAYIEEMITS